jgi:hypothetical protein
MIHLLAQVFRGLHMFVGISEPPPGYDERRFVMMWLGGIVITAGVFVLIFLIIAHLYKF